MRRASTFMLLVGTLLFAAGAAAQVTVLTHATVIDGSGEQSMDFVHVHDIARSVVMSLDADPAKANVPINIGTGIDTTVAELARTLIAAVGVNVEPQFNPREVLVSRRAADITRAREVLGWEPTIDVQTGMKELVHTEIV